MCAVALSVRHVPAVERVLDRGCPCYPGLVQRGSHSEHLHRVVLSHLGVLGSSSPCRSRCCQRELGGAYLPSRPLWWERRLLLAGRCSGRPQGALLCTNWRPRSKLLATQHLLGQRDPKGHQLCGVLLSQAWAKIPGARWTSGSERKTQEGCCGRGVAGPDPAPAASTCTPQINTLPTFSSPLHIETQAELASLLSSLKKY